MRLLIVFSLAALIGLLMIRRFQPAEAPSPRTRYQGPDKDKDKVRRFWKLNQMANQHRVSGAHAEAAELYQQSLAIDPLHEDSLYYLGLSREALGEYRAAADAYRKMIEGNSSSSRAYSQLGEVLSRPRPGAILDIETARQAYTRTAELNPEHSGSSLNLGRLSLDQGRFTNALGYFQTAAQFGSPEGRALLGFTLLLEGRPRRARKFFRQVFEADQHERQLARRGSVLEGDAKPAVGGDSSTQRPGPVVRSMLYSHWARQQAGGDLAEAPADYRVQRKRSRRANWRDLSSQAGLARGGGRAAWADFNQDGAIDLAMTGAGRPVRLYRNTGKRLVDVTEAAGLRGAGDMWDAIWGDYDGDGYPDLYLIQSGFTGTGRNRLFHNNRDETFTDVTAQAGLGEPRPASSAILVDIDGDGRAELIEAGSAGEDFGAVRLFRNQSARWHEEARARGIDVPGTVAALAIGDYNRDGAMDLFVLRWRGESVLYRNNGAGIFIDATEQAGLEGLVGQGFSALFFDFDNDRYPDLLVTAHAFAEDAIRGLLDDSFSPKNSSLRLFRNQRNGAFKEVTKEYGLLRSYGIMQALAVDADSDGWLDLVLANGSLDARRAEPSVILRNENGKRFREWSRVPSWDRPMNAIGVSAADWNQDGRQDFYFASHPVFRNTPFRAGLFTLPPD